MDYLWFYTALVLLLAALAAGWALTLVGLPGNWLMVGAAALYAWLAPTDGVAQISWQTVVAATVLAAAGELAELAASVWGARRAGGSRRAAVFSLFGSLGGALLGAMVGIPIPVVGSAVAAVLGGAVGALAGAAFAEHSRGEMPSQSLRVGQAAFWGRLLGTGAKTFIATLLALVVFSALFV
ncbi:MAG: DUF456 domain-containing protein [Pirellulales bacterium]|nr:DUF456 domain-containing protein [Pirellulales bacterium]